MTGIAQNLDTWPQQMTESCLPSPKPRKSLTRAERQRLAVAVDQFRDLRRKACALPAAINPAASAPWRAAIINASFARCRKEKAA